MTTYYQRRASSSNQSDYADLGSKPGRDLRARRAARATKERGVW